MPTASLTKHHLYKYSCKQRLQHSEKPNRCVIKDTIILKVSCMCEVSSRMCCIATCASTSIRTRVAFKKEEKRWKKRWREEKNGALAMQWTQSCLEPHERLRHIGTQQHQVCSTWSQMIKLTVSPSLIKWKAALIPGNFLSNWKFIYIRIKKSNRENH